MPTVNLLIKGMVQGVYFRVRAKEKALQLGLTGWIRNRRDGDVETVATGDLEQIDAFIDWCKTGPSDAVVKEVAVKEMEEENFNSFSILR